MNFERGGDPIETMKIGRRALITKWLDNYQVSNYTIIGDSIDIDGNLNLKGLGLGGLPEYIQFNRVSGYVNIENNRFTTLKGFPIESGWDYNCSSNLITSLNGITLRVKGSFYFHNNRIIDLDDLSITAINVICYGNAVKFTEEYIRQKINVSGHIVV